MFREGTYSLWNAQDADEQVGATFERRILGHRDLRQLVPRARDREKLYRLVRDRVVEVHAADFDRAILNARDDFGQAAPCAEAVQAVLDDVYPMLGAPSAPQVEARAVGVATGRNIEWNIDFKPIAAALGPMVPFTPPMVLSGLAHANRIIWSSALMNVDLYVPAPMARLVGSKLREANDRRTQQHETLDELKLEVDFPDVRSLVNSGALSFSDVLKMRRKAGRFRTWLQTQSERDRNAIIAYHHEVARESGFKSSGRKAIQLLGIIAGVAATGALTEHLGPTVGLAAGSLAAGSIAAVAGRGVEYVLDVAARMDAGWKPVVFGDWSRGFVDDARVDRM